MKRTVIIGTTGAGKTTFGRALAVKLSAAFVELDALYWHADWTPAEDFTAQVERALGTEAWVVDGNYSKVQELVLAQADTVVWLDYSFGTKLWRLVQRTCRRAFGNERLWNGNTESVQKAFFSRQSIFLWFFKTHWRQRKYYETRFAHLPPHLVLYRLYTPGEAKVLLSETSSAGLATDCWLAPGLLEQSGRHLSPYEPPAAASRAKRKL